MPLERFPQVPFAPPSEYSFGLNERSIDKYLDDLIPNLGLSSFEASFNRLSQLERPVVLDLFSPATALRSLRIKLLEGNPQSRLRGASVTVNDMRMANRRDYDRGVGISVFEANIASIDAQMQVDRWLNGDLLDLTMSLPYAGFSFIPNTLRFYQNSLKWLLDRTNPDGGMIVLQTPPEEHMKRMRIPMRDCLRQLEKDLMEYEYVPTYQSADMINPYYGLLYVKKHLK